MTLFKPTIKVNRLVVLQSGHTAFDVSFRSGVNILCGRNASGKTTVMDLLAFSLGAENIRWKPEALLCTNTLVEVQLNGEVATLQREISAGMQRPMSIFWGALKDALAAGPQMWAAYPFRRTPHRISFTQALFDAMDLPQAQADQGSNLTMHQLLRVIYADQPSVHSPIFRLDNFDSPLTREMIGGYLGGVYDDDLYAAQLRLREVSDLLSRQQSDLRSIFNILGRSGQVADLVALTEHIAELEAARASLAQELLDRKNSRAVSPAESKEVNKLTGSLRDRLSVARKKEAEAKDRLETLQLDLGDSILFVRELENRLTSLEQSKETRSYFGAVRFQFCPSCLSPLDDSREDHGHCYLCLTKEGDDRAETQLLRMKNEINIQIKESTTLIETRKGKIEALRREIPALTLELKNLELEYKNVTSSWSSEVETLIEQSARKLGVLDEEIRQSYERQKLASIIGGLQEKRDTLLNEQARLEETILSLQQKQEMRKVEVATVVGDVMKRLLKLDLPLQEEFKDPKSIAFEFIENAVYVNGTKNFAESSAVVLRHIFHLALLSASVKLPFMRFPRFLMLDGIDDGGMEKERSHRLQEIIVEESSTYPVEFQLIFATSEINPALENGNFVIGRSFTPEARSLDIG